MLIAKGPDPGNDRRFDLRIPLLFFHDPDQLLTQFELPVGMVVRDFVLFINPVVQKILIRFREPRRAAGDDDDPTGTIAVGKRLAEQAFGQMTGTVRWQKGELFRLGDAFQRGGGDRGAHHGGDPGDQNRWPGTDDELAELRKHKHSFTATNETTSKTRFRVRSPETHGQTSRRKIGEVYVKLPGTRLASALSPQFELGNGRRGRLPRHEQEIVELVGVHRFSVAMSMIVMAVTMTTVAVVSMTVRFLSIGFGKQVTARARQLHRSAQGHDREQHRDVDRLANEVCRLQAKQVMHSVGRGRDQSPDKDHHHANQQHADNRPFRQDWIKLFPIDRQQPEGDPRNQGCPRHDEHEQIDDHRPTSHEQFLQTDDQLFHSKNLSTGQVTNQDREHR